MNSGNFGNSELFNASATGQTDLVKEIITVINDIDVADVDIVNDFSYRGTTPLIIACCRKNNMEIVKLLVQGKSDINRVDKNGWFALKMTVRYKFHDYTRYLIKMGAKYDNIETNDVYTKAVIAKAISERKLYEINTIDLIGRRLGIKIPVEILKYVFKF